MRLVIVVLALLTCVVLFHAILLLPTYFYARGEVVRGKEALAAIDSTQLTAEEEEVRARAARVKAATNHLSRLEGTPAATAALRSVLAVPSEGIGLTGFTYAAAASAEAQNRMDVSGIARSREALRSYVAALDALPSVESAELPISAYAKETNIPFTITLSGSLTP